MIPLGINNKIYTNSKTRYRTNFIKILTIKKLFRIHTKQLFFVLYIQDTSKIAPRWVGGRVCDKKRCCLDWDF